MKWLFLCPLPIFLLDCFFFLGGIEEVLNLILILILCWLCVAGILSEFVTCLFTLMAEVINFNVISCQYFPLWFIIFVYFKRNHSTEVINAFAYIASKGFKAFPFTLSL